MQNIHTCKYRKRISIGKIILCATKLSGLLSEDYPSCIVFSTANDATSMTTDSDTKSQNRHRYLRGYACL